MIRKLLFPFCLIVVAFVFSSCISTSEMVCNEIVINTEMSLNDKMKALNWPEVNIQIPDVIFDGSDWLKRATELVMSAEESIVMSFFLASECDENSVFFDALREKSKQGIQIYMIVDGAWEGDQTESKNHMLPIFSLRQSGIKLHIFNPFSFSRLADPAYYTKREHRKFLIVDSEIVVLGGMNMNYMSTISSEKGQRDSMYVFRSTQLASLITEDFIDFWEKISYESIEPLKDIWASKISVAELDDPEEFSGKTVKAYYINQPLGKTAVPLLFGSVFYSAKTEIDILPLIPIADSNMLKMSEDAAARGVKINLILPNDPRKNMYSAGHYAVSDLLNAGINVYSEEVRPETESLLHEKLMIVDDRYVLLGSVNFNYRSMTLSNEIAVLIDDEDFAHYLKNHFVSIMDNSYEITLEESVKWRTLSGWIQYLLVSIGG